MLFGFNLEQLDCLAFFERWQHLLITITRLGIIRTFLEATLTLSTMRLTPRARHGFSAYFHPQPPLWDDPALLRNDEAAAGVAETLDDARAIVLRTAFRTSLGEPPVNQTACGVVTVFAICTA